MTMDDAINIVSLAIVVAAFVTVYLLGFKSMMNEKEEMDNEG